MCVCVCVCVYTHTFIHVYIYIFHPSPTPQRKNDTDDGISVTDCILSSWNWSPNFSVTVFGDRAFVEVIMLNKVKMESGSPRSGWFLLVPCTALCRGSDKYLSNWMGWNYETAGPHVWFFISKPRALSLGHRCQQKTENEACRGSFFCDSFSVLRAGKRNSLSGVTQFTWRETPEMSSHGW